MTLDIRKAATYLAIAVATSVFVVAMTSVAAPVRHTERESLDMTRACIHAAGHSTQLTISGTSAGSSQLSENTVYEVTCTTAVYIEWGDSAAPTANSDSNYLPADMTRYYASGVGDNSRYVAAVQVASAGTCYLQECE